MQIAFFASVLALLVLPHATAYPLTNLICNGDFESYQLQPCAPGERCAYLGSNFLCWYDRWGGVIEVKRRGTPWTTNYCELVHSKPYTLCQTISLHATKLYQINFTNFNPETTVFSTITVTMNSQVLFNHTTLNPMNVSHASYRFVAEKNLGRFCFKSVFMMGEEFLYSGPGLDNFSLVKLSPDFDYYDVFCTTGIEDNDLVIITCQIFSPEVNYYLKLLTESIQCFISRQKQDQVQINLNPTFMEIRVVLTTDAFLKEIYVQITQNGTIIDVPVPQFRFHVTGLAVMVTKLNDNEHVTLQNIGAVSKLIASSTEKVYSMLKNCAASYFLMSLINFWNLSLMYNVLSISTVPAFVKTFLQKLTFLFFNLNSLTEWTKQKIPQLGTMLQFKGVGGREFVEEKKNGFPWFGAFGISSSFLENNFQTFILLFLLLVKISLIKVLRNVSFLKSLLPSDTKLLQIFFSELVSLQTFMVMSSTQALLNLNFVQRRQKTNGILQTFNGWILVIAIMLNFIISVKLKSRKSLLLKSQEKQEKNQTPNPPLKQKNKEKQTPKFSQFSQHHHKRVLITELKGLFDSLMILIIPSLILFNNPSTFLLVSSALHFLRFYWFCKNWRRLILDLNQKVFDGFNILFWTILQVQYISLWALEKIQESGIDGLSIQEKYSWIKVIGFIIILTILLGGIFQILRFFVEALLMFRKMIKFLMKRYQNSRKIQPHEQEPQQPNKNMTKVQIIFESLKLEEDRHIQIPKHKVNPNNERIITRVPKITLLQHNTHYNRYKAKKKLAEEKNFFNAT